MARQTINIGTSANDGTGDTLRDAGEKINDNFGEIYYKLGGDSDSLTNQIDLSVGSIVFEGSSLDEFETSLSVTDPTADRSINFPDADGEVVIDTDTQTLTNKTLTSPVITTPQINDTTADHQYVVAVSELTADRTITLPLLIGNDTFVFAGHEQTLTNKTLTTPAITNPDVTGGINDANGSNSILLTATGSAVNEITVTNAATGNAPSIVATGTDTNVKLELAGKGSGGVEVSKQIVKTETKTANGSASTSVGMTIGNKATALALTLPNGSAAGQIHNFIAKGAGDVTVTPTSFASGTSVTIQQGEAACFFWDGSNWFLLASYNGTLNT